MKITIVILFLAFFIGRLFCPHINPSPGGTYEAFAHFLVMWLIIGWVRPYAGLKRWWFWVPLTILTAFEIAMFLYGPQ